MNARTGNIEERQLSLLDDPGMSDAERAFADEYIRNGFVASAAYRETVGKQAKSTSARNLGSIWLRRDSVRQYLRQRLGELATGAALSQEELVRNSRRIALAGLGEIPLRKSLVGKDGRVRDEMVFEPNLTAANTATAFLGKVIGIGSGDDGAVDEAVRRIEVAFVSADRGQIQTQDQGQQDGVDGR